MHMVESCRIYKASELEVTARPCRPCRPCRDLTTLTITVPIVARTIRQAATMQTYTRV